MTEMRISGINPETAEPAIAAVLRAQAEQWGAPLINSLVYARRPTIFRAVRGMWGGIAQSGLIEPGLQALLNRRVAVINRCAF